MIELKDIVKTYDTGGGVFRALDGVSLKVEAGELVAIMGPSGSGKSTLMHILGLLDVPDSGSYRLDGKELGRLTEDQLAVLRREGVGFVFQQFNLLPRMTALENVALPLLYSEHRPDATRAGDLLERVGLGSTIRHRPNQLSGGQQQRVAIARSLINRPRLILADEPTGNLDSASAKEILEMLKDFNDRGVTVILVTHDAEVARQARRVIRIRDGVIQSDERLVPGMALNRPEKSDPRPALSNRPRFGDLWEHVRHGFKALNANKVRTVLSMLGILIGVAAFVAMLALGRGAQRAIEQRLASLGSNLLVLRPGAAQLSGVALEAGAVSRLTLEDAATIGEKVSYVKDASPSVTGRAQVSYRDKNWNTQVLGAGPSYARIHAAVPQIGRFFTDEENRRRSRVAVVGATVVRELFGDADPLGEFIKINRISFQVIGILPARGANAFRDQDDVIVIPVLTAMHRLLGRDYVDSIEIEAADSSRMDAIQKEAMELILTRHRVPLSQQQGAYQIRNMTDIREALSESSRTMSTLLAYIAAISLLVGGIGIMNIMLVSVTERTREIGLRKAIGARRRDILSQFLAEAVVITTVGGCTGIGAGWIITELMARVAGWTVSISLGSILLAFFFSGLIGILFGIYPARKASLLNPIEALRYE